MTNKDFLHALQDYVLDITIKPNSALNGGVLTISEVQNVLTKIKSSFDSFIEFKIETDLSNNFKSKTILKIKKEMEPLIIKAGISSFNIGLAPNLFTNEDNSATKIWRISTFKTYKKDVMEFDYNNNSLIPELINKYPSPTRESIFRPITDIFSNNNLEITITSGNKLIHQKINTKKSNYKLLIESEKSNEEIEYENTIGNIIINKKTGIRKITDLFDNTQTVAISFSDIIVGQETLKLKHPVYADYRKENQNVYLENSRLEIYAHGNDLNTAKEDFCSEFMYKYNRFMGLKDEQLTLHNKEIKNIIISYL